MGIATAVVIVLMLLCVTFTVVAAVRAARAVNRGLERASTQVRRGIDDTSIRIKAAQPGVVGQLARIRLDMRASVEHARRELTEGVSADGSLREALGLLDQLHDHARLLDRELAGLIEREPDRDRIAKRLPEVRERAAEIKASADSLRFAAQDRARRHDVDDLASLREQIDIESGALRHWTPAAEATPGAATKEPSGTSEPNSEPGSGKGSGSAGGGSVRSGGKANGQPRPAVGAASKQTDGAGGDAKWDLSSIWEARNQLPGLRQRRRTRDVN